MTVPSLDRRFGGPVAKSAGLSKALINLGHDVIVVGAGEREGERTVGLGAVGAFHATPFPRHFEPLSRLIRDAHVVHVIGFRDPVGTVASLAAARRGVPVVLEPVGMIRRRIRSVALKQMFDASLGRRAIEAADMLIASSSVELDDLVGAGIPDDKVAVRPNGVAAEDLLPLPPRGAFRRSLDIPDRASVALVLARMASIKGLPAFVEALGRLGDMYGVIAGPDERDGTREVLERRAADLGLGDRLQLMPDGIWGPQKVQALVDADVVCLPSSYESFGSAAAEAACVGVPVVVTDRCGVGDVLDPSATEILRFGDAAALAGAIERAATLRSSAEKAAPSIRERLDWLTLAGEQVAIYRGLRG